MAMACHGCGHVSGPYLFHKADAGRNQWYELFFQAPGDSGMTARSALNDLWNSTGDHWTCGEISYGIWLSWPLWWDMMSETCTSHHRWSELLSQWSQHLPMWACSMPVPMATLERGAHTHTYTHTNFVIVKSCQTNDDDNLICSICMHLHALALMCV